MLNYVIYASMGILSSALMVSFIKIRNIVKNGNPDRIRASLFLRYGVFKRTILFIIDGMTFIFFVQVINMLFGLQYLTIFYHQVMIIASLICLIVIGYAFIHPKFDSFIFNQLNIYFFLYSQESRYFFFLFTNWQFLHLCSPSFFIIFIHFYLCLFDSIRLVFRTRFFWLLSIFGTEIWQSCHIF